MLMTYWMRLIMKLETCRYKERRNENRRLFICEVMEIYRAFFFLFFLYFLFELASVSDVCILYLYIVMFA